MSNEKKEVLRSDIIGFAAACATTFKEGRLKEQFENIDKRTIASIISSSIRLALKDGHFGLEKTEIINDIGNNRVEL